MNIFYYTFISIWLFKETMLLIRSYRFSVSQMVISDYADSVFIQILCESLIAADVFHHPVTDLKNRSDFCWLDSNHDENAKLYGTDGKNEPTLIAEGVVEFGLNDDYVVYGKNEVVWLYSFTTEKEYRLTPMDENAQFIGVSNDMVFWYDVSTRGRDVVKYLLIP